MLDTPTDRHLRGGWRAATQNLRPTQKHGLQWVELGVTSGKGADRTSACSGIQSPRSSSRNQGNSTTAGAEGQAEHTGKQSKSSPQDTEE